MRFHPTLKVPKTVKEYDTNLLKKMLFSLGLCELPSYWKPTCSPNVIIECGHLDEKQIAWTKKLMLNGLGEFFYQNGISSDIENFTRMELLQKKILLILLQLALTMNLLIIMNIAVI